MKMMKIITILVRPVIVPEATLHLHQEQQQQSQKLLQLALVPLALCLTKATCIQTRIRKLSKNKLKISIERIAT